MVTSKDTRGSKKSEYRQLHYWVEATLGKPSLCADCGIDDISISYEWANISKEYKREASDWERLCASCHRRKDMTGNAFICLKGHYLSPENTYIRPDGRKKECRKCRLLRRPTEKKVTL